MNPVDLLPHQPPMRLVEQVLELRPGESARATRRAHPSDWYFNGHFPGQPVVPAIVLTELLAQTAGLAAAVLSSSDQPIALRVAGFGPFKFPAAAEPGMLLEATARVVGRIGALVKVEGEVTADGRPVAVGSVTLAEVAPRATVLNEAEGPDTRA
jgi:3-hydroxyacyl-[acyl-carrier-protein] dehydratase